MYDKEQLKNVFFYTLRYDCYYIINATENSSYKQTCATDLSCLYRICAYWTIPSILFSMKFFQNWSIFQKFLNTVGVGGPLFRKVFGCLPETHILWFFYYFYYSNFPSLLLHIDGFK